MEAQNRQRTAVAALGLVLFWVGCAHGPKPVDTGTLTGKVVDVRGRLIGGARVYLMGPPRGGYDANGLAEEMVTSADGKFEFRNLFPGIYTVDVSTEPLGTRFKKDIQIDPGRLTEIELTVPSPSTASKTETRMGTIRGTVVSEDGRGLQASVLVLGAELGAYSAEGTGRFAFDLPIGIHTVRVQCTGYRRLDQDSVWVSEGDTTTVDFKLEEQPFRLVPGLLIKGK